MMAEGGSVKHGWILREGVWSRCTPPLRVFTSPLRLFCTSPENLYTCPFWKISMMDESENLTFFGCLGSTLCKNVFL